MSLQYISPQWQSSLFGIDITDFESLWQQPLTMIDDINYRRGGMSSVGTLQATSLSGENTTIFIKRQEHHRCRHPKYPWMKIPTLCREYQNLCSLVACGISIGEPVFYSESGDRAILGVQAVPNAIDLPSYQQSSMASIEQASIAVAKAIADLHNHHWQHTALYPKHIFINPESMQVSFIDLESARKRLFKRRIILRDLDSLNRHMIDFSVLQRARFLKHYLYHCNQSKNFSTIFRKLCKKYQLKMR